MIPYYVVGGYEFKSKKTGEPFVFISVRPSEVPSTSVGDIFESYMCSADRLPCPLSKMIGHKYIISTRNNFVSSFYGLPDDK